MGRINANEAKIERELQDLPPQRRYEERLKREMPLLDEFRAWADARTVAPQYKLGQAFVYLANQRTPLTNYPLNGRLKSAITAPNGA